jgi:molecular chaperone DnaK
MSLGRFRLDGIPPAPRGVPQVEVSFDIDANGILNVLARDKASGKEQNVTITASTNLTSEEIEQKVADARQHEADDKRQRDLIDARNTADNIAYQTEKSLGELGDKVPGNERENIQGKVNSLRETLTGDDTALIRQQTEELQTALHALSQQMYAQQTQESQPGSEFGGGNGANGANGSGPTDEGEVVEGEFREA